MTSSTDDEHTEEFNVWPSFVDLLAATSLLFVTLVAVFILVSYQREKELVAEAAGLRTEREALVFALRQTDAARRGVYTVVSDSQFVRLLIQEEATFPHGQYLWDTLRDSGKIALRDIGRVLSDTSIAKLYREVRVIGHSDSVAYTVPSFSNWELSASRAAVVARYLVTYVTVDPCKISAMGVGPYYPREDLDSSLTTLERNTQNRRIEIEVIPARAAGQLERTGCNPFGDGSIPGRQGQ